MLTLAEQDIQLGAKADDKQSAIRMVAQKMVDAGLIETPYVDGMLRRETQNSTYLGNGIAIPHGTTDTREQVKQTGVRVLHFADGVNWGDGQIAHVVIGIAARSDEHLGILRQLTRVLADDSVADYLKRCNSTADLAKLLSGQKPTPTLLLDSSTIQLQASAQDILGLQSAACALLQNTGALESSGAATVQASTPVWMGQGLWLARTNVGVKRTAVSLVRPVVPFQHAGQPVQGLLLIAAQDALHKPVLERLVDMISEQNVAQLWAADSMKAIKLLTEKPIEGLEGVFTITNPHGLHARPSATLVKVAKEFQSEIWVANLDGDGKSVNAKSLMKLVSLGVKSGHRLQFIAKGDDAQQAISKIGQSIADGLGEGAGHE
jgi:phosphocarrier protein FPr